MATPFQLAPSKSVVPAGTRVSFTDPSACSKTSLTRSGCTVSSITGSAVMPLSIPRSSAGQAGASAPGRLRRAYAGSRGLFPAERRDPRGAPLVVAEQEVGRAHRLDDLLRARVHDRAGQPVARGDREEPCAERLPARQPERGVR